MEVFDVRTSCTNEYIVATLKDSKALYLNTFGFCKWWSRFHIKHFWARLLRWSALRMESSRIIRSHFFFRYDRIWTYGVHYMMIAFYHQVKIPISFWYRWDLNPDPLRDDKRLYPIVICNMTTSLLTNKILFFNTKISKSLLISNQVETNNTGKMFSLQK